MNIYISLTPNHHESKPTTWISIFNNLLMFHMFHISYLSTKKYSPQSRYKSMNVYLHRSDSQSPKLKNSNKNHSLYLHFPHFLYSLFPIPYSLFSIPYSPKNPTQDSNRYIKTPLPRISINHSPTTHSPEHQPLNLPVSHRNFHKPSIYNVAAEWAINNKHHPSTNIPDMYANLDFTAGKGVGSVLSSLWLSSLDRQLTSHIFCTCRWLIYVVNSYMDCLLMSWD